jgi:hypothetical protein
MGPRSVLRFSLVLLLAVALGPCASASRGDLSVDHVALQGEAVLAGRCRVVQYAGIEAGDDLSLTIVGETLVLELDTRWANRTTLEEKQSTRRDEYHNGTFDATAFRAGHELFLADVPGRAAPWLQWTGTGGLLEASAPGTVEQSVFPPEGHPPRSIDIGGTVEWTPSPGWTSLSATGDFYLALWEVDGQASEGRRTASYTTGETAKGPTAAVPLIPSSLAVDKEDRLLHVFAFNATLEWRFQEPDVDSGDKSSGVLAFHVTDAAIDSPAPIALSGATGTLSGNGAKSDVHEGEVRVASGRLESVQAAGDRLVVSLAAPDDAISVDGQQVVWPRPEGTPRWAVVAAAAALAAGLALAWRWSGSGLRRLERVMDRGLYADVLARRGRIGARHAPKANVLHAVSLLALRRPDEASRFLEGLVDAERPEPPTFSYLLAAARAGQGKTAEAARLVRDCLTAAPEYLPEVMANPSLLPLLQAPGPRPPREGAEGGG